MNRKVRRYNRLKLEADLLDYAKRVVKLELTIKAKKEKPPAENAEAINKWNTNMQRLLEQREKIGTVYDELFGRLNEITGGVSGESIAKLIETHADDTDVNPTTDDSGKRPAGLYQDLQPAGLYPSQELL